MFFDGTGYIITKTQPGKLSKTLPVPQIIEFDLAVSATEGTEAKAGIGIFAGAIGLGTQAKLDDNNVTVSRIKFSIPLLYPEQKSN